MIRRDAWQTTTGVACLVGLLSLVLRLPAMTTTLGEQDQGRFITMALYYAAEGADTGWNYGLLTSPLWIVPVSHLATSLGVRSTILLVNGLGWLCGGLVAALGVPLLERLGCSRRYAGLAALTVSLTPAVFYMSTYGYPSEFALAGLAAALTCFAIGIDSNSRAWLAGAAACYCLTTLLKVDFAVAGTAFASLLILKRDFRPRAWLGLAALPLAALGVFGAVVLALCGAEPIQGFVRDWRTVHTVPTRWTAIFSDAGNLTIFYAFGWGTTALAVAGILWRLVAPGERRRGAEVGLAWLLAVGPLLVFWMLRHVNYSHPMSARHALPAAFFTGILAVWLAHRHLKALPWLLPLLVVGANWPFGTPRADFNYFPSGNLLATTRVNHRVFREIDAFGEKIAASEAPRIVIFGEIGRYDTGRQKFDAIDPVPSFVCALAERHGSVRPLTPKAQYRFRMGPEDVEVITYAKTERLLKGMRQGREIPTDVDYFAARPLRAEERSQARALGIQVEEF